MAFNSISKVVFLTFNLSLMGCSLPLSLMRGEGSICPPPYFICEINRKSIKIMHRVDFFCSCSFEDMGIFHDFYLVLIGGGVEFAHKR